jgi:hypothetical protein
MSFLLRFVSHSAAGREIVRTRRVEGDVLTIGRDPASDVHFPDLAIARQHATITRTGPRQLLVEALAGSPVKVDGHARRRAHVDLGHGGEVRIAVHRIVLALGDTADIVVTIDEQAAPDEAADISRGFSLAGKLPGRRGMAWAGVLLVLGLCLAWPIWSFVHPAPRLTDAQMAGSYTHSNASWSSGPLSRAHAGLQHDCRAAMSMPSSPCRTAPARPAMPTSTIMPISRGWRGHARHRVACRRSARGSRSRSGAIPDAASIVMSSIRARPRCRRPRRPSAPTAMPR